MRHLTLATFALAVAVGTAIFAAPAPFAKRERLSYDQLRQLLSDRALVVTSVERTERENVWIVFVAGSFDRSGKPYVSYGLHVATDGGGPRAALRALLSDPGIAEDVYRLIITRDVDESRIAKAGRQLQLLAAKRK